MIFCRAIPRSSCDTHPKGWILSNWKSSSLSLTPMLFRTCFFNFCLLFDFVFHFSQGVYLILDSFSQNTNANCFVLALEDCSFEVRLQHLTQVSLSYSWGCGLFLAVQQWGNFVSAYRFSHGARQIWKIWYFCIYCWRWCWLFWW